LGVFNLKLEMILLMKPTKVGFVILNMNAEVEDQFIKENIAIIYNIII